MQQMEILELDPTSENVIEIISDIDKLMNSLYPQESNKQDDGVYGELKRIYVKSKHRGKGLSKVILQNLITHAKNIKLPIVRLEAGIRQPEALSLYTKIGFKERAEFGSYKYDPLSIYMELEICT
jgi:putative acetyltransferase